MLLDMLRVAGQLSRVREGHGQGVPHVAQERPVPAIAPCKWWRRGPGEGHNLVIGLAAAIVLSLPGVLYYTLVRRVLCAFGS